jgi:hypothetical protein
MSAAKKENSDPQSTARIAAHRQAGPPLATWLAALLFLFAALAAVPVSATASAKALCVSHNRTGGNSTSAVQWCPAQGPRTGALNWEKLPGEYVPGGSGVANAARMAGQISADWAAENSGELGGLRPTYDEAAIATSGPVGDLGDAVVGKVTESIAPVAKGIIGKIIKASEDKVSSLVSNIGKTIGKILGKTDKEIGAVAKSVGEPHEIPVHELNEADVPRSRDRQRQINASVKKEGVKEPIQYVEINGKKFVVNGNHRLRAARSADLETIPGQEVKLPYLGYKNEHDVLTGGG